jgi:hypothetical protein
MMSLAKEYIKCLCEREQGLFPEPLKESVLTETDILEIERGLGYALPEQYREFLQSWQLPEWAFTVYVTFCGDYPNCFWKTYSREKGGYIPSEFGDTVTVELVWYGSYGNCAADYLGLLKRQAGEMTAWLEAGFIQLGAYYMEDYFLFYDLAWGNVRGIHNEDIYEVEDRDGPAAVRAFMDREAVLIFPDFNTFLRFACLGEPYDEEEMIFRGTDQNSKS